MFELGCINSTEWAVYQDWHSLLVEQFGHRVELEGIIYLRAPPKVQPSWHCVGHLRNQLGLAVFFLKYFLYYTLYFSYISDMHGAFGASGKGGREGSETGLLGKAA